MSITRILIVEGASGVGKTSLITDLLKTPNYRIFVVAQTFSPERLPTDIISTGELALIRDQQKLVSAFNHAAHHLEHDSLVLVDRCILSQVVYHQIRDPQARIPYIPYYVRVSRVARSLKQFYQETYKIYLGDTPFHDQVKLYMGLLTPSPEDILNRRAGSLRDYPAGLDDIALYQNALVDFQDWGPADNCPIWATIPNFSVFTL